MTQIFYSGQLTFIPNKGASQSLLFHVPHHMYEHEFLLHVTCQHPRQTVTIGRAQKGCRNNSLLLSCASDSCATRAGVPRLEMLEEQLPQGFVSLYKVNSALSNFYFAFQ